MRIRRYEIKRVLATTLSHFQTYLVGEAKKLGYTTEMFVMFPKNDPVLSILTWKEKGKIIAVISDLDNPKSGFFFPDIIYVGNKIVITQVEAAIAEYESLFPKPAQDEATNLKEYYTLELPENLSPLNLVA